MAGTFNKLVIFDCDGTLSDGQHSIYNAMSLALKREGLPAIARQDVRNIIGLSLAEAFAILFPDMGDADHARLAQSYKAAFFDLRTQAEFQAEPLYDGTVEALEALDRAGYLLAVATGKSLRGLKRVLGEHNLLEHFISLQTADFHPSKPHPSMVQTAILDAGASPDHTIVIGDTSYDMTMALNAGVGAVGVSWGYHNTDRLLDAGAHGIAGVFAEVPAIVDRLFDTKEFCHA